MAYAAHKHEPCGGGGGGGGVLCPVSPTIALGSGFRRTFDIGSKTRGDLWSFDLHWNYEYVYSW